MVRNMPGGETPEDGPNGEVLVCEGADGEARLDVGVDRETVWLTQRQMAQVFDTTPENVLMHLRNVFASGELEAGATTKEFLAVRTVGRRIVAAVGSDGCQSMMADTAEKILSRPLSSGS